MKIIKKIAPLLIILALYVGCNLFLNKKATLGSPAPAIETTLINGSSFSLEKLKGKYIVLEFWGSWCLPCRAILPQLIDLQNKNDGSFEIVSVALEKNAGNGEKLATRLGFNWIYQIEEQSRYVAMNKIARDYGVSDIPATFLIDTDGQLVGQKSIEEIKKIILSNN